MTQVSPRRRKALLIAAIILFIKGARGTGKS